MIVEGDIYSGMLFRPGYAELTQFMREFEGLLLETKQGWTYAAYNAVPDFTTKDLSLYDQPPATRTRSFDSKQALLTFIRATLDNAKGIPTNAANGLALPSQYTITRSHLGFIANHIPQLYTLMPQTDDKTNVVTGFSGSYDFHTRLFKGFISYRKLAEIWNEQL